MIPSMEATRAVNYHRKDALVVATSSALREWSVVSQRRDLDVDLKDCMDRAPAVGLGLALCKKIVELHQGEVTIDSQENKGTQVRLTLPTLQAKE